MLIFYPHRDSTLVQPTTLCYKENLASATFQFMTRNFMDHTDRSKNEPIEVICPICRVTEIIYIPVEDLPLCPKCQVQMLISELLDEGKSY